MSTDAPRLRLFRALAHQVHLGRCARWPFGDCTRHEEPDYFTPKDNDIASQVLRWLTVQKEDVPVFVDDEPPRLVRHGFEEVPARHVEFITHTRLRTDWHSDECPDCTREPGVHDRRQAEMLTAALERDQ